MSGGETIVGREQFKRWIEGFLAKVDDLHLEVVESFQNADGSRVLTLLFTGRNNGILGTASDAARRDEWDAIWAVVRREATDELGGTGIVGTAPKVNRSPVMNPSSSSSDHGGESSWSR